MGIGDWGLGIGDWGLGPMPNPQSPYKDKIFIYKIKLKKEVLLLNIIIIKFLLL